MQWQDPSKNTTDSCCHQFFCAIPRWERIFQRAPAFYPLARFSEVQVHVFPCFFDSGSVHVRANKHHLIDAVPVRLAPILLNSLPCRGAFDWPTFNGYRRPPLSDGLVRCHISCPRKIDNPMRSAGQPCVALGSEQTRP